MIGIIGGGFGLYGWLPALCQFYDDVWISIESRHKEKFIKRPELQQYRDRIDWVDSVDEIINDCAILIFAIPPNQVYGYLDKITNSEWVEKIIVEKPICETPEKSEQFIKAIEDKGIKICSSYLFIYTDWFKELDPNKKYSLMWIKGNPNDNWKSNSNLGGGEIFYNIHLLSIQSENIKSRFIYSERPEVDVLIICDLETWRFNHPKVFPLSTNEELIVEFLLIHYRQ